MNGLRLPCLAHEPRVTCCRNTRLDLQHRYENAPLRIVKLTNNLFIIYLSIYLSRISKGIMLSYPYI